MKLEYALHLLCTLYFNPLHFTSFRIRSDQLNLALLCGRCTRRRDQVELTYHVRSNLAVRSKYGITRSASRKKRRDGAGPRLDDELSI